MFLGWELYYFINSTLFKCLFILRVCVFWLENILSWEYFSDIFSPGKNVSGKTSGWVNRTDVIVQGTTNPS